MRREGNDVRGEPEDRDVVLDVPPEDSGQSLEVHGDQVPEALRSDAREAQRAAG